jgi:hypothetical protein
MRDSRAADFQLRMGIRPSSNARPRVVCHGLLQPTMLLRPSRWSPVRPRWLPRPAGSFVTYECMEVEPCLSDM